MLPLGLGSLTRAVCKRARRGLYAGKTVMFGNKISENGGNKSRRMWKPNAQRKRLFSVVLNRMLQLRVTTAALRTMDKVGGLDAYILTTPAKKLQSDLGEKLQREMLDRLAAAASDQRQLQQLQKLLPPAAASLAAAAAAPRARRPLPAAGEAAAAAEEADPH